MFKPSLVGLKREHAVDRKVPSDVPQKINVVERPQPFRIVEQQGVSGEVEEAFHLRLETLNVLVELGDREHFPNFGLTTGIPDHGGATTHQRDNTMPGALQVRKSHQRNQMPHMQRRRGGVKTDIGAETTGAGSGLELFGMGGLLKEATLPEGVEDSHLIGVGIKSWHVQSKLGHRRFRHDRMRPRTWGRRDIRNVH